MLKNLLLFVCGAMLLSSASLQNITTSSKVGNCEVVKNTPVLKSLADNVNVSYDKLITSASGTKTDAANAKAEYSSALTAYQTELKSQISLRQNKKYSDQLQAEITLVNSLITEISGSTK